MDGRLMTVIRFFTTNGVRCKNSSEAIDYLYSDYSAISEEEKKLNPNIKHGVLREPAPLALSDNQSCVIYAIEHTPHKYKYSSGVIAYHANDTVTLQNDLRIDIEYRMLFEEMCFAGLPPEDRLIEWCRHSHAGNIENHFVIPRIHLKTGYYFNPHPPASESDFKLIVDYLDAKYLLTNADTPEHQQPFGHISPYDPQRKLKLSICQQIRALYKSGELKNKKDILNWLSTSAFKTQFKVERVELKADHTRLYFSGKTKAIRLKGSLFSSSKRQFAKQSLDLSLLERELCKRIQKRADFNQRRYRVTQSMVNPPNYELPLLVNKLDVMDLKVTHLDSNALLEAILLLIKTIFKLLKALFTGLTGPEHDENRRTIISVASCYEERHRTATATLRSNNQRIDASISDRAERNHATDVNALSKYAELTNGTEDGSGSIETILGSIRAEIEDEQQFENTLIETAHSTDSCCRKIADTNRKLYEFIERSFASIDRSYDVAQRVVYKFQKTSLLKRKNNNTNHNIEIEYIPDEK